MANAIAASFGKLDILFANAGVGIGGTTVYTASKGAVSAKLVGRGVRINTISPGPITTPVYGKLVMPADQVAQMGDGIRT